jgi:hypothetical protein
MANQPSWASHCQPFCPTLHPETIIACPEGILEFEGATPDSDTQDTGHDPKPNTDDDDWHLTRLSNDPSDETGHDPDDAFLRHMTPEFTVSGQSSYDF